MTISIKMASTRQKIEWIVVQHEPFNKREAEALGKWLTKFINKRRKRYGRET